jgi:hypothetical protein
VVILISVIVVAVAFTLFRVNVTHYIKEDARQEQDANLRVAMATVVRDLRMAGNGFALLGPPNRLQFIQAWVPGQEVLKSGHAVYDEDKEGWFIHADEPNPQNRGIRAVFGVDGGEDGPDTLSVFRAEVESGAPVGYLESSFEFGSNILNLSDEFPEGVLHRGDILVLVDRDQAALVEIAPGSAVGAELPPAKIVTVQLGGRFTPMSAEGLAPFPPGTSVFNLRNVTFVTYYIGEDANDLDDQGRPKSCLMADYHDLDINDGRPVPVASNIEDFQVFYFYDNEEVAPAAVAGDPAMSSPALDVRTPGFRRVKAVGLGMVARAPRRDRNANSQPRPALFNREAGTVADEYTRNMLTEIVHLRNF